MGPMALARRIGARAASVLLTVLLASVFVFVGTELLPGDAANAILGRNATPQGLAILRRELALDSPPLQRYFIWLGHLLTGHLGTSLLLKRPVLALLGEYGRNTAILACASLLVGVPLAFAVGIVSARWRGRLPDRIASTVSVLLFAVPEFLLGSVLILIFAVYLRIVPAVTVTAPNAPVGQLLPSLWLPTATLSLAWVGYLGRMLRSSLIDSLESPWVSHARLSGFGPSRVLMRHALPCALPPAIATASLYAGSLLGGIVVVETVFNYPGLGSLMVDAVTNRDVPVIQAIAVLSALIWALLALATDALISWIDPRAATEPR
jgi:peptide/nickel transport system permease protein